MIKLINILREVVEGAKVNFNQTGNTNTPVSIEISPSKIEGEQLVTVNGSKTTASYKVYYSLESAPGATNIKNAQDALKQHSELIDDSALKRVIAQSLSDIAPPDYIGYLESEGGLSEKISKIVKQIYPRAEIIQIEKMSYANIRDAVDWDRYKRESEAVKKAVDDYIKKREQEPGPYKIKKSDNTQSLVIQRLHSKYNIGLNPNLPDAELPEAYNMFVKCITEDKTMLIVDDNIHQGIDFLKLFTAINSLVEKLQSIAVARTEEEDRIAGELQKIIDNPKFSKSTFLQDKYKELTAINNNYKKRVELITNGYKSVKKRIAGYVLYMLKDSDMRKTKVS